MSSRSPQSHKYRRCDCGLLMIFIFCFSIILQSPICHSSRPQPPPPFTDKHCAPERCGAFNTIPFPFHLNPSCQSLSDAFHLSCSNNSTSLFLNIASQNYQVLHFFPDGVSLLIDYFPNTTSSSSSSCRPYNDFSSFSFQGNNYFSISTDNVLGLYDCDDSSSCKAEEDCENITTAGICHNTNTRACCYPLSDPSIWHLGDGFSVFSLFGCRGFSSWVASGFNNSSAKRGVKLEWAVPSNSIKGACDSNARIVNATSGMMRCQCLEGFVGDGFALGVGCLKSCLKNGKEAYGKDCYMKEHGRRTLLLLAGILTSAFSIASLAALFRLLKGHSKSDTFNPDQAHGISFRKACRTHLFTHQELEEATRGFDDSQKLVDINKGTIYAGVLEDGSHLAVQKVHCACERDLIQALSRVEVLYAVSHRSMARLLGCCIDSGHTPLVVYEYPANGTLEEHLRQSREHKIGLDWHKRLNIAAETASVLAFLQCEIFPPIFHHDLQSGCILLDEDYSVKLAGFELFCEDDPDLNKDEGAQLDITRSDVYSLGVVLLEIIAGGRSGDLPAIALHKIRSGKLEEIVDPLLYYHEQPGMRREQIDAVADLATRCLLFCGDGKLRVTDVARELAHIRKESDNSGSRRGPSLEETFSNSSLLQMISMSPDSIYLP